IPTWKIADDRELLRIQQTLLQRATTIPGVRGVAIATELPALQPMQVVTFSLGNHPREDAAARHSVGLTVASPDYFAVMGIPIVRGRAFTSQDAASPAPVVVISRVMALRFWGDESRALGAQIVLDPPSGGDPAPFTVIGVSSDVANSGLDQAPGPQMYGLASHRPARSFHLIVRAHAPETLGPQLRAAVRAIDPDLPTYQLRTVEEAFADGASSNRLLIGMFAAFAIVALLL